MTTLEALFRPRVIAVIGASRSPGKLGYELVNNLLRGGFQGRIVPVNPSAGDILGLPCVKSLQDLPDGADLALVSVPKALTPEAVKSALDSGVKAIVVITSGFKETGKEGAALEKELSEACSANGARMLGPNCLGLINTQHRMNASFGGDLPLPGAISIISQSGALCTAILDLVSARGIGLSKLVSLGNKADLDESDMLTELSMDDDTRVVVGYLESIADGDEFMKVAERAASVKPIVIMKAGTTAAGSKAASSHTGSLAGADVAYGAAFKRAGVVRAESFESLFDYATAFAFQPLPRGSRVAIVTNAGGPGIMAADAVENEGLVMASLSAATKSALSPKLPPAASVANPVDVLGDAAHDRYGAAIEAVLGDDGVDAAIVILTPQAMTKPVETARAIAAHARADKPVLACFMGGTMIGEALRELTAKSIPNYGSPERAVHALKAMSDYSAWKNRAPRMVARFPVNRRRVERIIARQLRIGRRQIGEVKAKEILRAYDFHVPPGRLAMSAEEAVDAAVSMGLPVAMKIASQDIVHKSDMGGVKLNLASAEQVRDAYDLMMMRIGGKAPEARIDGVYVERMCGRGREVIIGMTRDPQFGPMLMFGLGGIFVEILKDVTFHLAPITAEEAMQMLRGTRSYKLLSGARGQAGVDLESVAGSLQRISQLVTDFPEIEELDINPLIIGEAGIPPVAADARITLSPAAMINKHRE